MEWEANAVTRRIAGRPTSLDEGVGCMNYAGDRRVVACLDVNRNFRAIALQQAFSPLLSLARAVAVVWLHSSFTSLLFFFLIIEKKKENVKQSNPVLYSPLLSLPNPPSQLIKLEMSFIWMPSEHGLSIGRHLEAIQQEIEILSLGPVIWFNHGRILSLSDDAVISRSWDKPQIQSRL